MFQCSKAKWTNEAIWRSSSSTFKLCREILSNIFCVHLVVYVILCSSLYFIRIEIIIIFFYILNIKYVYFYDSWTLQYICCYQNINYIMYIHENEWWNPQILLLIGSQEANKQRVKAISSLFSTFVRQPTHPYFWVAHTCNISINNVIEVISNI